jgi:Na+-transporting methylmalonyl-CoA/oxaloacetate decarboxylase gamma subunit
MAPFAQADPAGGAAIGEIILATGGAFVATALLYRTTRPIPVHDDWKAMVRLHSGRSLLAAPVYLTIAGYGVVLAIAVSLLGFIAWSLSRLAGDREEPAAPQSAQPPRTAHPASNVGTS